MAALCGVFACGATNTPNNSPPDGSTTGPGDDAGFSTPEAGIASGFQPSLVLVNGLVKGVTPDVTLGDVRVCVRGITTYPLPDDHPMPLSNFPGVAVGSGVDLGAVPNLVPGTITVDVFDANDLQSDATWQTKRLKCSSITCATGASCKPHASLQVTIADAVTLLVLTDNAQQSDVTLKPTALDGSFSGTPGTVRVQVANFAGWHTGDVVDANFGPVDHTQSLVLLASALTPDEATTTATLDTSAYQNSYENYGVWVDKLNAGSAVDTFGQSLGSVQWASDPTTAPASFYDVRKNFAFILVGDPANTSLESNGRDPTYDGRALHFVAVPFAAGVPLAP